jgi:glycosyltransferase involved in cell wall biosynthesis
MCSALNEPDISFVMPVLHEERHVIRAMESVVNQRGVGDWELIALLGQSADRTDELVAEFAANHPQVVMVRNPENAISAAMNLGVAQARFPTVVRVDAHAELPADYTATMAAALRDSGAANVGGRMRAAGVTPFEKAVARAYNSRVGLGGGVFHVGGPAGPAESAYLGVFERDAVIGVGGYDETLSRGEDWELNLRLRRSGREVWFVPEVEVIYRPRSTLRALARQFHASGRWRGELIRRAPGATPLRHLLPLVLVIALAASVLLAASAAIIGGAVGGLLGWLALVTPAAYVPSVVASAVLTRGLEPKSRGWLAVVLPTMHVSWGMGCLVSLIVPSRGKNAHSGR